MQTCKECKWQKRVLVGVQFSTESMDQSTSWKADSCLDCQEISRLLWKHKFCCLIKKIPPSDIIQSQMALVHILIPFFINIHFNIILPSQSRSPKLSPLFSFLTKIIYAFLFLLCDYMSRPSYNHLFTLITFNFCVILYSLKNWTCIQHMTFEYVDCRTECDSVSMMHCKKHYVHNPNQIALRMEVNVCCQDNGIRRQKRQSDSLDQLVFA
jgi:hypothetical protein